MLEEVAGTQITGQEFNAMVKISYEGVADAFLIGVGLSLPGQFMTNLL